MSFIVCLASDIILYKAGILLFNGGWNIYLKMLMNALCLLLFLVLERKYRTNYLIKPSRQQ
jgi:hypothetical protein